MLDDSQKKVVESSAKRLIVEAPAGFGKTTTMVSLVNKWINDNIIKNHKKILCLTYTISAANRMKEALDNNNRFYVTNFHGLCRRILSLYGNYINIPIEKSFKNMTCVDTRELKMYVSTEEYNYLTDFDNDIKSGALIEKKIKEKLNRYNNIIRKVIVSKETINYNSILTLTIELLLNNENILSFYKDYFPAICVDEFQDTNILGLILIKILSNKRVVLFGDELQRIYGFLGAIPNIFDEIIDEDKNYKYIKLTHNHRFRNNKSMLQLDNSIRKFQEATQFDNYVDRLLNTVDAIHGNTIENEAQQINSWIKRQDGQVAILIPQNSNTSNLLKSALRKNNVTFFDATFGESDSEFIHFEEKCLNVFQKLNENKYLNSINKKELLNEITKLCSEYKYGPSYIELFKMFINDTIHKIQPNKRNNYVEEILLSKSLRNYLNLINSKVIYIKIHGSKGLEWDHVIIANFNQWEIPNYYSIKEIGNFNSNVLNLKEQNTDAIKKLVMLFYVAFSRAKKDFIVAYSSMIQDNRGRFIPGEISCISSLPFISVEDIE